MASASSGWAAPFLALYPSQFSTDLSTISWATGTPRFCLAMVRRFQNGRTFAMQKRGVPVAIEIVDKSVLNGDGYIAMKGAADPERWKGPNLLGFALMEARERLRATP